MSSARNSSPILRSRALWGRLLKGIPGLCGCRGNTFHKKTGDSIPERALQMTVAVRSTTFSPLVGRLIERPQRSACSCRWMSSVKARPVRRPPRWPGSRPIQRESTSRLAAASRMDRSVAERSCGASVRSYRPHRSEYGLKVFSRLSSRNVSTNSGGFMSHCPDGACQRGLSPSGRMVPVDELEFNEAVRGGQGRVGRWPPTSRSAATRTRITVSCRTGFPGGLRVVLCGHETSRSVPFAPRSALP